MHRRARHRRSGAEAGARQASADNRLVSRENLREAVFLWSTPRATPRCNSGCTCASAVAAASLSPASSAASTFLTKVRMRPTRLVLIRSEEHTSELQSLMRLSYAVFCLKKKRNKKREQ